MVAVASLLALAGCGAADGVAGIGGVGRTPAAITPTPTPTSAPTALTATASPTPARILPAATAVPAPQPQPPTARPAPMTLAITPLFPGGAAGSVTVVSSSRSVHYHVIVSGLVPGSAHTVHDHVGKCGSASRGMHLAVLATATADSHGVIVFDTTVSPFDFGAGRIVIVYDTARPILITGCAML
jgi:hypothetical protein